MIQTPTVFILGAGASQPFGFPIGVELSEQVVNGLVHGREIANAIEALGISHVEVEKFRSEFSRSGRFSVDAFLERREEFMEIGKLATAHVLMSHEHEERLFRFQSNWLKILYNRMAGTVDELRQSKVSFITFNYDRTVEHFLFSAITGTYGMPAPEARGLMEAHIPVVHLHGRLGYLPWQTDNGSTSRPYVPVCDADALRVAADNIKIIHEDITDGRDKEFAQAKALLEAAEKIILLGFGYNDRNIERLGIRDLTAGKAIGTCQNLGSLGEKRAEAATANKVRLVGGDCTHVVTELLDWP